MNRFVKTAIFLMAIVAGSVWVSNATVWVGNKAKQAIQSRETSPIEQSTPLEITPQSGN